MYNRPEYEPEAHEAARLIETVRLGTLVTQGPERLMASHLTFQLDRERGPHGTLVAHLARANPHAALIEAGEPCLVVFLGPHGYISSSWYPQRDSAPTWNFAVVHAHGSPQLLDRGMTARHIATLVKEQEQGRENEWHLREVGHRFSGMLDHVVGFEIPIDHLEAKFKMGQDERLGDTRAAITHLEQDGEEDLATLMRRLNDGRDNGQP